MSEKHTFQAEIQQLLNIVIHSLYTDKEIFIRELVSNAADAIEKLRFNQAAGQEVFQADAELKITITTDEEAGTVTIIDTGIGMTHEELVKNLGTIAHSGSKAFLKQLSEEKKPDLSLIGQFGVGFYSAFMVAKQVVVETRSFKPGEAGWKWTSDGSGGYETEAATEELPRGTKITLHLMDEQKEYATSWKLEGLVQKYSSFVPFPIEVNGSKVNTVQAIWARNRSEIKEEEYDEFFKFISHDQEKPLYRLHFNSDAPIAIQALLYVPAKNFESMGMGRGESEVSLYCRKVLIQPKAKKLFPDWLRFLHGAVDSEDLPLNISRETMQDTSLMQKLNKVLTTRFLKFLDEQAEKDTAAYDGFFATYARFIKEGIVTDFTHRDALAKLLRYESSANPAGQRTSLADYVKRMPEAQKEINYLVVPNRAAAEGSPYYEVFASKKFEVLFLYDPWDELVMDHLGRFQEKEIKSAEKSDLKIENPDQTGALTAEQSAALTLWLKDTLKDAVSEVRVSERLADSPAVVVDAEQKFGAGMRKIMQSMRKEGMPEPETKLQLEINPRHNVVVRLEAMRQTNEKLAASVAEQLLDNARVAAGLIEDPRVMLKRLNELLEKVLDGGK